MNDCITTTKQSTTKPCAYFLGYNVWCWRWFTFFHQRTSVTLRAVNVVSPMMATNVWLVKITSIFRRNINALVSVYDCTDDNSVVPTDTLGCRYDKLRCRQWRQSWHRDNKLRVIMMPTLSPLRYIPWNMHVFVLYISWAPGGFITMTS